MNPQSALSSVALGIVLALPGSGICAPASDDCVRSEPAPVFDIKQAGIRTHRFVPVSSHEAREYIVLTSGESLDIRLGGCEYFVTTFRVRSQRISSRIKAGSEAYLTAARVLRQLRLLKDSSGFDLLLAANTLEAAAKRTPVTAFEEPLAIEGDGIEFLQAQVQIDAVGQESGMGFVQITLFRGPL
jgi:hypothetical protein